MPPTGNRHRVSHNALIPSWCGIRFSNASPMIHWRGPPAPPSSTPARALLRVACGDMAFWMTRRRTVVGYRGVVQFVIEVGKVATPGGRIFSS